MLEYGIAWLINLLRNFSFMNCDGPYAFCQPEQINNNRICCRAGLRRTKHMVTGSNPMVAIHKHLPIESNIRQIPC